LVFLASRDHGARAGHGSEALDQGVRVLEVLQHAVAQHRIERESTEDLTGSFARALDQAYPPLRALFL